MLILRQIRFAAADLNSYRNDKFEVMKAFYGHRQYIWQREDWPDFRWNSELLLEPLAQLNHSIGLLNGKMSMLGFNNKAGEQVTAMTDDLMNSFAIESISLNRESVRSSIARKLGMQTNVVVEDHYVEGLVEVMFDATLHCRESLTEERLFGWHCALFPTKRSGMHKISVGEWRVGDDPMLVVSGAMGHEKVHYEAPPSSRVPNEMHKFLEWCKHTEESPVILSAIAHLWFVTIHPFDDGNGRISRTIADMFLTRLDNDNIKYYSVSAEINNSKKKYYEILETTQKGNMDITSWILWYMDCIKKAVESASERIDNTIKKTMYWDKHLNVPINERQRKVINRLWDGFEGKLTTSKWAKICHCSQDTALRDIKDLIAKGMLASANQGGRSANYILIL